jgi:hypothetical protein
VRRKSIPNEGGIEEAPDYVWNCANKYMRGDGKEDWRGLNRLRKNPMNAAVLKGHGFIRANGPHKTSRGFNP